MISLVWSLWHFVYFRMFPTARSKPDGEMDPAIASDGEEAAYGHKSAFQTDPGQAPGQDDGNLSDCSSETRPEVRRSRNEHTAISDPPVDIQNGLDEKQVKHQLVRERLLDQSTTAEAGGTWIG
jgi:hypothetical protein